MKTVFHQAISHQLKTLLPAATVSIFIAITANTAIAEQVRIPIGEQSDVANVAKPAHGRTKAQVVSDFGEPSSKRGPVGDPAIYFWEYDAFTVYFEDDRVIHAVSKYKSKTAMKK